jgi:hypothetical protein
MPTAPAARAVPLGHEAAAAAKAAANPSARSAVPIEVNLLIQPPAVPVLGFPL